MLRLDARRPAGHRAVRRPARVTQQAPPRGADRSGGVTVHYDVVVPTTGRASLARLLRALAVGEGPLPGRALIVADGLDGRPVPVPAGLGELGERLTIIRGPGRGPAAARNAGWRASAAEWIAFLDDDVVPAAGWRAQLV